MDFRFCARSLLAHLLEICCSFVFDIHHRIRSSWIRTINLRTLRLSSLGQCFRMVYRRVISNDDTRRGHLQNSYNTRIICQSKYWLLTARTWLMCIILQRIKILTTPWRDTQITSAANGMVQSSSTQIRLATPETPDPEPVEVWVHHSRSRFSIYYV